MLHFTRNNVLSIKAEALVNTVNCYGVSGAGVAKEFKILYPLNFVGYRAYCASRKLKPGKAYIYHLVDSLQPEYIINLATKDHWQLPSKLEWIEQGIETLAKILSCSKINSIALPPLGCSNGGLDWNDVEPLLRKFFEQSKQTITICLPY